MNLLWSALPAKAPAPAAALLRPPSQSIVVAEVAPTP